MPIEPHELFEGLDIAGAIETLNLPEATRDFLRDDIEVNAATEAALQQAPESLFPDDPLWTYWDYIPDEHKTALNAAAEAFDAARS